MLLTSDSCHKGRFFFSTLVEILGYNEDPETRQDATELEQGYIHFPRNERGVTSIARVWFLDSDEARYTHCSKHWHNCKLLQLLNNFIFFLCVLCNY